MSTLFLNRNDVRSLLSMSDVMVVVEQAFRDWVLGKARMPAKAYLALDQGDFRAMPAALPHAVGIKWVNSHPQNQALGLPTVMAIIIYNDLATGYPLAIMDATEITAFRTGATAALASKYLARKNSHTLGIVGAGRQAYTQLTAHVRLFDFQLIKVFDRDNDVVEKFIKSFTAYPVRAGSLEETVDSNIVCTVTPAHEPFLKREWVYPGTHINAIGADAQGKEELEPSLLKEAIVVVDDIQQAKAAGEINVPIKNGFFTIEEVYGTLGEIIAGKKPGRKDENAITIFDSTGLAIEDIAVAKLIYDKANSLGGYSSMDFL
ncbi:MAG: ornithine cyclodeaminase family protein [Dehalococcoidia bacterium]|jgi:alanine dehydrogenase|nr:ornithine cyclodeaminase family protein [Dehalococcoidia bacterium]